MSNDLTNKVEILEALKSGEMIILDDLRGGAPVGHILSQEERESIEKQTSEMFHEDFSRKNIIPIKKKS